MIVLPCPIQIADWPEIARRYGLHIIKALADDETGELTMAISGGEFFCTEKGIETMAEASHWLKRILSEMHTAAAKAPGNPVRRELKGGLRIDILINRTTLTMRIQLSRQYAWPSATEFAVVMNNLPYDVPLDLEPERKIAVDRYYLCSGWAIPEAYQ